MKPAWAYIFSVPNLVMSGVLGLASAYLFQDRTLGLMYLGFAYLSMTLVNLIRDSKPKFFSFLPITYLVFNFLVSSFIILQSLGMDVAVVISILWTCVSFLSIRNLLNH